MATVVIKTIKPGGGGDYVSLEAWDAAERADLVAADEIAVAECYPGGNLIATDTAQLFLLTGWTTGVNNYVEIRAAPGFHARGGVYDTTNLPFAEWNIATSLFGLRCGLDFFRLKGLQLRSRGGAGRVFHVSKDMPNGDIRLEENLFISNGTVVAEFPMAVQLRPTNLTSGCCGGTNGPARVLNNVIFFDSPPGSGEGAGNGFFSQGNLTEVNFINNTIIIPSSTPGVGRCLGHSEGGTGGILTSQNGYYKETGTATIYGGDTVSGSHDATSNDEAADAKRQNIAYDSANFKAATAVHTTFNVDIPGSSFLQRKGINTASDFGVVRDAKGLLRALPYSIGAHRGPGGSGGYWQYWRNFKGARR